MTGLSLLLGEPALTYSNDYAEKAIHYITREMLANWSVKNSLSIVRNWISLKNQRKMVS